MEKQESRVKAATTKQLAERYGMTEKGMRACIELIRDEVGIRVGHYFTPRQVSIIDKHVGALTLLIFGSLIKTTEAMANNQGSYASGHYLTNDDGNILQGSDAPTPIYYFIWFSVLLLASYFVMVFKIKSLIERFIDTPENRRLAIVRSQDKKARGMDALRISIIIVQITVILLATVFAGYLVGKLTFAT